MTDCIEQTRSAKDIVLEARELIAAAEQILALIELAAWRIGETSADNRDNVLKAFDLGISIHAAAEISIEKLIEAGELLSTAEFALPEVIAPSENTQGGAGRSNLCTDRRAQSGRKGTGPHQ